MSDWIFWMAAAGVLAILEMLTGTFYLLMIAIGLVSGGLAALAGAGRAVQIVLAAVAGILATLALRRSRLGKITRPDATRDPNVNLDIGQTLFIEEWQSAGGDNYIARAMYRGASWDIQLQQGGAPKAGSFVIREVRGNRLIVANNESDNH